MTALTRNVGAAVGRAVAIVMLVLLCLALLAGAEMLVRQGGAPAHERGADAGLLLHGEAVQAWLATLSLCIGLFLAFGLWKALRVLYHWLFSAGSPFGQSVSARLVGLGVAVLLFPRGVQWLMVTPVLALAELVRAVPERLSNLMERGRGRNTLLSVEDAFARLLDLGQVIASELARLASRLLEGGGIADLVLAMTVWVLVSRLIDRAPGEPGVRAWLARLDDARRRLLILGGVFLAGIFFSVASIVAIPYLQDEKQPANLTRESLEKLLEGSKSKPAGLEAVLPKSMLDEEPMKAASAAMSVQKAEAAASGPGAFAASAAARAANTLPLEAARQLEDLVRHVQQRRDEAKLRAIALRDGVTSRQAQVVTDVAVSFETEMRQQLSSQERFSFFRQMQHYAQQELAAQVRVLQECRQGLEAVDRQLENVARGLLIPLREQSDAVRSGLLFASFDAVASTASGYGRVCTDRPFERINIVAPEAGTGWGPFGWIANWLLRTRSFALTLITGMLGFGLLGAAISSFVRADPVREGDPRGLVGHVVIRGVSAAVVVFLAVKGGLAIFASGSSEPNAYVLFFTCLVGAVFSEDVWTWARAKFKEKLLSSGAGGKALVPKRLRAAAQVPVSPKITATSASSD